MKILLTISMILWLTINSYANPFSTNINVSASDYGKDSTHISLVSIDPREGTCFLTKHGILTVGHIAIESGLEASIGFRTKGTISKVILDGTGSDVALIQYNDDLLGELELATCPPTLGERVIIYGTDYKWRSKIMSATVTKSGRYGRLTIPDDLEPGDSGSPVVNQYGKVIGIVSHVNYAKGYLKFQGLDVINELIGLK